MRKVVSALLFIVGVVISIAVGQDPNCNGTSAEEKTSQYEGGVVPPTYYQSNECQGDLEGVDVCKHAIAFNMDKFKCDGPVAIEGYYHSYCVDDTAKTVECTHKRKCLGEVKTKTVNGVTVEYTHCSQDGEKTITYAYKKKTLSDDLPPPEYCVKTMSIPKGP